MSDDISPADIPHPDIVSFVPDGEDLNPADPAIWADAARRCVALAAPPGPSGGRPTRFTASRISRLLAGIAMGDPVATACRSAGIDDETMRRWRAKGDGNQPGYSEFCGLLLLAEGLGEEWHIRNIRGHGTLDWKASAFMLDRRYRDSGWGKQVDLHVSGTVDHNHMLTSGPLPYETADRLKLAAMLSRPALPDPESIEGEFTEVEDEQPDGQ